MPPTTLSTPTVTKEGNILRYLLEALDAAWDATRHARPIPRATYPFIVQTKLSDTRLGSMQGRGEYGSGRVGCPNDQTREAYGERELFDY